MAWFFGTKWLHTKGGFIFAPLPHSERVALILIGTREKPEEVAPAIATAEGNTDHKADRVYLYHGSENANAPVSHVLRSDGKVVGFSHPSISEETFVLELVRKAEMI